MSKTRLSKRAIRDLEGIWKYVAEKSAAPAAATRLLQTIHAKFKLLGEQPYLGEVQPEIGSETRTFVSGNYLILYRILGAGVEILGVMHSSRDLGRYLEEEATDE